MGRRCWEAALPTLPTGRLLDARARDDSDVAKGSKAPGIVTACDDSPEKRDGGASLARRTTRHATGFVAPAAGLEPAPRRLTEGGVARQGESLRELNRVTPYRPLIVIQPVSPCARMIRRETSARRMQSTCLNRGWPKASRKRLLRVPAMRFVSRSSSPVTAGPEGNRNRRNHRRPGSRLARSAIA
jgi:hypothetical protein